jgi:hypothetical protein
VKPKEVSVSIIWNWSFLALAVLTEKDRQKPGSITLP